VTVVPEGFEPPATLPQVTKESRPTVVFCARMVPYKRPEDVVRAVELAARHLPGLQAWMIGGGPDLKRLKASAPPSVTFWGRVDEDTKMDLMARAHVHVATSIREGWGLVVSEAAALGTPTIAYDTPGLRDSTSAAGGVVIPPSPEALAHWLTELLPVWQTHPPVHLDHLDHGGAHSWDHVADEVLAAVSEHAMVPAAELRTQSPVVADTPRRRAA